MERLFLQLARMSLSAGWLVLVVLALRLLLKKAPKRIVCVLWALRRRLARDGRERLGYAPARGSCR